MNTRLVGAGFYGKLPSHGDFLSRRLPRGFIEPWDEWLQSGLAASREQLGRTWLDCFLVSPIWQFALSPGLCGADAWAGVMMPSVDRVGRYFPLTLAANVMGYELPRLFDPDCRWFDALSELALSSLDYQFDLNQFDERLAAVRLSDFLPDQPPAVSLSEKLAESGRLAFEFQLDSARDTPLAFNDLGDKLTRRFLNHCSYWRSTIAEEEAQSLLLCEGLPPGDAYVGFLNGQWPQRGWGLSRGRCAGRGSNETVLTPAVSNPASYAMDGHETVASGPATVSLRNSDNAWQSFGLSVVGLRRKLNEDAILQRSDAGMWAVADGMGGHSAGDVASQALVAALAGVPPISDLEHYSEQVASCLHTVNHDLLQLALSRGDGHIIGSTIVVLLIQGAELRYLWAGDSRLYRYRYGALQQLTIDHSLYNESIGMGMEPLDGSLEQGRGNIITRAVGADQSLQLDFGQGDVLAGDLFILCSDGLDKELGPTEIAGFCGAGSPEEIARQLVLEAEQRGGRDNISVIVVKAGAE